MKYWSALGITYWSEAYLKTQYCNEAVLKYFYSIYAVSCNVFVILESTSVIQKQSRTFFDISKLHVDLFTYNSTSPQQCGVTVRVGLSIYDRGWILYVRKSPADVEICVNSICEEEP